MYNLSICLRERAPVELFNVVSECYSEENLVVQLANDPSRLFSFLQNVRDGYEPIAAKALVKVHPKDLENADLKKVERVLRNKGMLSRATDPDIRLTGKEWSKTIEGHKNILALEAPMFMEGRDFIDHQKRELELADMGVSENAYQYLVDYLYLPDGQRKEFATHVDKSLLIPLAKLSDIMGIEELRSQCDDELCNSIGVLGIQNEGLKWWMAQANPTPKFAMLLGIIKKVAGDDGSLGATIKQMENLDTLVQLVSKCTPQEIALFATLKTEFGVACLLKDTKAFGKAEWEKAFPVTIIEVPPLPSNIHAVLELEDPCEAGKKLKETCMLFLRPQKVILHEESGGNKEITLGFDGVEELAMKATNPDRRTRYRTFAGLRDQMNQMPVAESGWVLMRKEVITGSRGESFENQKTLLKGGFVVPELMDAILLNILTYAGEGKYLYGSAPWTYTRCQEMYKNYQTVVGGFVSSGLNVGFFNFVSDSDGLAGCWKFLGDW